MGKKVIFVVFLVIYHPTLLQVNCNYIVLLHLQLKTVCSCFLIFPQVYGGGVLSSTNLHIDVDEVIVDAKGTISVDESGYPAES